MDKKLQLIRHLYEETGEETKLNELLEDAALKQEFQALSEAKFWLDHSKKEKPSSDALQAVLTMAMNPDQLDAPDKGKARPFTGREDRKALPRQRTGRKRMFGVTAFALATILTAFVGYQLFLGNSSLLDSAAPQQALQENVAAPQAELADDASFESRSVASEQAKEKSSLELDAQLATEALAPQAILDASSAAGFQAASVAQADSSIPDWDKADDVILYRQRIDMLLEQNQDIAWDETAVPLESLRTTQPTDRRLLQAGSRANNN